MHPFKKNIPASYAGMAIVLLWGMIHFALVIYYLDYEWGKGVAEAMISTAVLGIVYYYSGYFIGYIRVWQAQLIFSFLVPLVCQSFIGGLLWITGLVPFAEFSYTLPLRLFITLLSWIILIQWYTHQTGEEEREDFLGEIEQPDSELVVLERITVKEGTKIHILPVEEILYIQAGGDYVNFFTSDGQYIKEWTMKYLETHLPDGFVRVHRSTIVNTVYVHRVELFAKDSWQIRLRNGTSLRASLTGYRLLKARLGL